MRRIALAAPPTLGPGRGNRPSRKREQGFHLLDLLLVLALLSMLAALSIPPISAWSSGLRVRLAADEVRGAMNLAKVSALRYGRHVAVKFRTDSNGEVSFALYRDGDGDGVRNRDIDDGTDPLIRPPARLGHMRNGIHFGFPAGKPPRDPNDPRRRMTRLHDPIRFNRSDLASFGPIGTATPGTVYITDGSRHLIAVRVQSRSGRVRLMVWEPARDRWR